MEKKIMVVAVETLGVLTVGLAALLLYRIFSSRDPRTNPEIPDRLLHMILARIPLPDFLKVRQLSKTLKDNFREIGRGASDVIDFPLQFPCFFAKQNREIRGFDPYMGNQTRIHGVSPMTPYLDFNAAGCGSLMVVVDLNMNDWAAHVTNIVIRETRILHFPAQRFQPRIGNFPGQPILAPYEPHGYELIIWFKNSEIVENMNTHIMKYNSMTFTWITNSCFIRSLIGSSSAVYMEDRMYFLNRFTRLNPRLEVFNIRTGISREAALHNLGNNFLAGRHGFRFLVRCGSAILILIVEVSFKASEMRVFRLNLDSLQTAEVSAFTWNRPLEEPIVVSSSNCIYIFFPRGFNLIIFNLDTNEWLTRPIHDMFYVNKANLFVFEPRINLYAL